MTRLLVRSSSNSSSCGRTLSGSNSAAWIAFEVGITTLSIPAKSTASAASAEIKVVSRETAKSVVALIMFESLRERDTSITASVTIVIAPPVKVMFSVGAALEFWRVSRVTSMEDTLIGSENVS